MTEKFDIEVYDKWRDVYVDAVLIKEPPADEMANAKAHWDNWLSYAGGFYQHYAIKPHAAVPHGHWPWGDYALHAAKSGGAAETYTVVCDDMTQAMMVLTVAGWDCRLPTQKGFAGVYLDLIGTAPWNTRSAVPVPRYTGVGSALMARAVMVSKEMGMKGRLGLHALPGASTWYTQIGMVSLGPDPDPQK